MTIGETAESVAEPMVVNGPLPGIMPPLRLPTFPGLPLQPPARESIRPGYTERFRCIASACEDTCCQGWGVPIDRATYEKYRSSDEMKPHLGTLIVLNTTASSSRDYARIASTPTGTCGFLDEQKMCGIQKRLGEAMLSTTCAVYPRVVATRAGEVEKALHLSCPEAARLVLLEPDLLGMDEPGLRGPERHYQPFWGTPRKQKSAPAVREFAVLLLRDRSYTLWQRIYLLGTLVHRLHTAAGGESVATWCDRNGDRLSGLLGESARLAATGRLRLAMVEIEAVPGRQLELVAELCRLRMAGPPVSPRFRECLQSFESGMGFATAHSEQQVLERYEQGRQLFYQPLMDQHPAVMENYLINHVFKNDFSFGGRGPGGNVETEYVLLCLHAMLARTILIGMARHYGLEFGVEHVVKLIQSLARTVEHNREYLDQIAVLARGRGLADPRFAASLLR